MGNQNLVWDAFGANVECCPIGYEIRRVFTQPGPKGDIRDQHGLRLDGRIFSFAKSYIGAFFT